jgi:hypothetical protein
MIFICHIVVPYSPASRYSLENHQVRRFIDLMTCFLLFWVAKAKVAHPTQIGEDQA